MEKNTRDESEVGPAIESEAPTIRFTGSNMSSRAYEAAIVGGVPKLTAGEDPAFGLRLAAIGETDRVEEIIVTTTDRYSTRVESDMSLGQTKLKLTDELDKTGTIKVNGPERMFLISSIQERLARALNTQRISVPEFEKIFTVEGNLLLTRDELILLVERSKGTTNLLELLADPAIKAFEKRISEKLDDSMPKVSIETATEEVLGRLLGDKKLEQQYNDEVSQILQADEANTGKRLQIVGKMLDIIFSDKPKELTGDKLSEIIESHTEFNFDEGMLQQLSPDQSTVAIMARIIATTHDSKAALNELQQTFLYELMPAQEHPLKMRVLQLRAMDKVIKAK